MKTKIATLSAPEQLEFEERELNTALSPCQVLAKTKVSVISPGTELAAYLGHPPLRPGKIYPRLVGYCNVAEVLATGDQVKNFQVGDLILSFQSHRSAFVIEESEIISQCPEQTDASEIATAYLFHLGYHSLLETHFEAKDKVAVVGLGTIGLTTTAVASQLGADVSVFSNQSVQRASATDFGAARAYPKALAEGLSNRFDLIVLTTNAWSDWQLALELAAVGARIAVLGFPGRTENAPSFNPLASQYLYDKQLTIKGIGNPPNGSEAKHFCRHSLKENMTYLISAIGSGKLPAKALLSARYPNTKLEEAYQLIAKHEPGVITAAIDWVGE